MFPVAPSEALLLGLCLGEYLLYQRVWEAPPRRYFIDVLLSRLHPHVPSLRESRSQSIDSSQIPDDVVWPHPDHKVFGWAVSVPGRLFHQFNDGKAEAQWFDCTRRSLFDLLIRQLGDSLSINRWERWFVADELTAPKCFFELISRPEDTEWIRQRFGEESPAIVQERIERLIQWNECGHVFAVGRDFGKLVYVLDDFESFVWNVEEEKELFLGELRGEKQIELFDQAEKEACDEFERWLVNDFFEIWRQDLSEEQLKAIVVEKRQEIFSRHHEQAADDAEAWKPNGEFRPVKRADIGAAVQSLLRSGLIRQCTHAERLLQDILNGTKSPIFDTSRESDLTLYWTSRIRTISQVANARMVIWLAFGEVLGVLRDSDRDFEAADSAAAISRTLQVLPSDSADEIHQRLLKVESDFNNDRARPEEIVTLLAPTIEALAKRVWPRDFSESSWRGELSAVLHGKLHSAAPLDVRFASIAITLHKAYRNMALHDLDSFRCSFEEARFFLAGVRTLVDLLRRMK